MNLQSKYWTWTTGSYNTDPSAGNNRQLAPSTRIYESQCTGSAWTQCQLLCKTSRTIHQQPSRPLLKRKRARTHRAIFFQGFSNHHGQISQIILHKLLHWQLQIEQVHPHHFYIPSIAYNFICILSIGIKTAQTMLSFTTARCSTHQQGKQ